MMPRITILMFWISLVLPAYVRAESGQIRVVLTKFSGAKTTCIPDIRLIGPRKRTQDQGGFA